MSSATPPHDWEDLIQEFLDETISPADFDRLQQCLREHPDARERYFTATQTAGLLREFASHASAKPERLTEGNRYPTTLVSALTVGILAMGVFALVALFSRPPIAATLSSSEDAIWLSSPLQPGEEIREGVQVQLASGSVQLQFQSGATTRLSGPTLFEIQSKNDGFLRYGEAFSTADTEDSQGFTIHTASGDFVDQGTEFLTTANLDGYSQLHVTSGAVDVDKEGFERQRVITGNGVGIESGTVPLMIQIERGRETPEFDFPAIPPPSSTDFASQHPIQLTYRSTTDAQGKSGLSPNSEQPEVLIDGRAQKNNDDPQESFFFRDDTTGYLIFDLGSPQPISSVHTYSWHRNREEPEKTLRAVQRFTLWGSNALPAAMPSAKTASDWTRIARVDTDAFFHVDGGPNRPPQQACRIFSNADSFGEFRYLLFEVIPTSTYDDVRPRHTFFSEIDIFTAPR